MNSKVWKRWKACCWLLIGLSSIPLMANTEDQFNNRVNLALRQAGHHLLLSQQDSTSTIAPVENDGENGFLLRLENVINYSALPGLLEKAFADYDILENYEVVIKACETKVPLLGYNRTALGEGEIPCMGRDHKAICGNLFVQFSQKDQVVVAAQQSWFHWLLIPLIAGLGFWYFKKIGNPTTAGPPPGHFQIGQYSFDPKNQLLILGAEKFTLTFRENKLLHHFAKQPNEVLTRSEILSNVWEDEGIIVGRSLDVFISRIRKLLKKDPAVQLKNVHGVGYRLELK